MKRALLGLLALSLVSCEQPPDSKNYASNRDYCEALQQFLHDTVFSPHEGIAYSRAERMNCLRWVYDEPNWKGW